MTSHNAWRHSLRKTLKITWSRISCFNWVSGRIVVAEQIDRWELWFNDSQLMQQAFFLKEMLGNNVEQCDRTWKHTLMVFSSRSAWTTSQIKSMQNFNAFTKSFNLKAWTKQGCSKLLLLIINLKRLTISQCIRRKKENFFIQMVNCSCKELNMVLTSFVLSELWWKIIIIHFLNIYDKALIIECFHLNK